MIVIVDYGMGNFGSMLNIFKRIGAQACVESDPDRIAKASKVVLPGVGAFDAAMERLNKAPGLREVLNSKALIEGVPLLGVCLGMQLLTESSEEGRLPGLGWIPGTTKRFPKDSGLKVPHMGWNVVTPASSSPLTQGLDDGARFYFVHSYFVRVGNPEHSLLKTCYGLTFDAGIGRDNIFGLQFHPEKSHRFGMQILSNFTRL